MAEVLLVHGSEVRSQLFEAIGGGFTLLARGVPFVLLQFLLALFHRFLRAGRLLLRGLAGEIVFGDLLLQLGKFLQHLLLSLGDLFF